MIASVDQTEPEVCHVGELGDFQAAATDDLAIFGHDEQPAGNVEERLLETGLFGRRELIRDIAAQRPRHSRPVDGLIAAETENPPRVTRPPP